MEVSKYFLNLCLWLSTHNSSKTCSTKVCVYILKYHRTHGRRFCRFPRGSIYAFYSPIPQINGSWSWTQKKFHINITATLCRPEVLWRMGAEGTSPGTADQGVPPLEPGDRQLGAALTLGIRCLHGVECDGAVGQSLELGLMTSGWAEIGCWAVARVGWDPGEGGEGGQGQSGLMLPSGPCHSSLHVVGYRYIVLQTTPQRIKDLEDKRCAIKLSYTILWNT